jgi:hypothetical protein
VNSFCYKIGTSWLRSILSGLAFIFICCVGASAHEGPPYAIIVDKMVGPFLVSLWGDPDVGVGTFFVILEPTEGSKLPEDVKVEIGVRPVTGRLSEAHYSAVREAVRGRMQYKADVPFDREELWRLRLTLQSSLGGGEVVTSVEVTPPGYGRWDMLLYLFPFLALAYLWLRAVIRGRSRTRSSKEQIFQESRNAKLENR